MGYILKQKATVEDKIRYANKLACRNCKCKCTIEAFRVVAFSENKDIVKCKFFSGKETITIKKLWCKLQRRIKVAKLKVFAILQEK